MSTNRKQSETGWGPPRMDAGKVVCRQCGGDIPRGRRTFCSKGCVHGWRLKTDPGYLRQQVFKRDNGICGVCGKDSLDGSLIRRARRTGDLWQADHIIPVIEGGGECGLENMRTLCTPCHKEETRNLLKRLALMKVVES